MKRWLARLGAAREALVAFAIWILFLIYVVGYSVTFGYERDMESLTFVLGFPDWVFWGIVVPWLVSIPIAWWFAMFFMVDETWEGEDQRPEEEI